MNITVYLGASRGNDPSYEADASALGAWIAEHGHTLIYTSKVASHSSILTAITSL